MIGVTEAIGLTKTDRKQIGETKALRYTSDCSGALEFDKDGRIDYSRVCPAHMLVYAQKLTAEKLGVAMSDLAQYPLFADYETSATVPTRYEVAVDSLGSPMAARLRERGITVITKEEERSRAKHELMERVVCFDGEVRGRRLATFFEVTGKDILVRSWGDSANFTRRVRSLAIMAQKQAYKAAAAKAVQMGEEVTMATVKDLPFGNAFKVEDLKGKVSTKSPRRTAATSIARARDLGGQNLTLGMKQLGHAKASTHLKYVAERDPFAADSPNLSDTVLRGKQLGESSSGGSAAARPLGAEPSKEMTSTEAMELTMLKVQLAEAQMQLIAEEELRMKAELAAVSKPSAMKASLEQLQAQSAPRSGRPRLLPPPSRRRR